MRPSIPPRAEVVRVRELLGRSFVGASEAGCVAEPEPKSNGSAAAVASCLP